MPELCLGKLVCKMLEAVARVTVAPTSAAFFSVFHPYPQALPVREVSCRSPSPSQGSAGPAVGAQRLLLVERRGQQPRGTNVRTEDLVTETPSLVLG